MGLRSPVVLDQGFNVGAAFGADGTPSAILVDERGRIASDLAVGAPAVLALAGAQPAPAAGQNGSVNGSANGAALAPAAPAVPKVGDPAPPVRLPDLDGNTVDLAGFQGSKTLVLFWNPGCGFCRRMLDDLKGWEVNPPPGAPRLLVVSTGTVEANRELGIRGRRHETSGGMAEWLKASVLKTEDRKVRGFESLSLRR